jgi:methyltransferase family protein
MTKTGSPLQTCAWCGAALVHAQRLAGRTRCESCGVATTDPWPSDEALDAAYGAWYRPAEGRFSAFGERVLGLTRSALAYRVNRIAPPGPVLDVGAGSGVLLDALRACGREAIGLERYSARPDIRVANVEDETRGDWAAIVFWHSLEHLAKAREALERTADLLSDDGVLVIAMPNAASFQANVFGDRWLALDLPRHLVHLTSNALLDRLRSLGFHIERVSYLRGGQVLFGWLHGLVGTLPSHPDLYEAIRRPEARAKGMTPAARAISIVAAIALLPLAFLAAVVEVLARRGGSVYVEARIHSR